ncbi:MAG: hypothetical protein F6K10_12085 [Moorea sp. SIO2B7]|nr:hypothetical protein [Moorena sp. SIO2B7]
MNLKFNLCPPPDNLQSPLSDLRDYYAALVEEYERLAELARIQLANVDMLLESWEGLDPNEIASRLSTHKIPTLPPVDQNSQSFPVNPNLFSEQFNFDNSNNRGSQTKTGAKIWTTNEVAAQLNRSADWCHNQRYKHPDEFNFGIHYLKDNAGIVQWTEAGIQKLLKFYKPDIPQGLFSTREVSRRLGVSTEWISKKKTKYPSKLVEGTHYYCDPKGWYFWTSLGVEELRQIKAELPQHLFVNNQKSSSKHKNSASQIEVKMLPEYEGLTRTSAIEKILEENTNTILHVDYIVTKIYGELEPKLFSVIRERTRKLLSKGKQQGKWDSVPYEHGCYTWDLSLVEPAENQD